MKKILIVLLLPVLFVVGCSNGKEEKAKKELQEITFEEYNTKINNEEDFVLYIGSTNCGHCSSFKPKLEEVINENNVDVYYLDISKITDQEYSKLKNKVFLTGTPTTTYFVKGKYGADKIVGDKDKNEIVSFLEKIGYIGD